MSAEITGVAADPQNIATKNPSHASVAGGKQPCIKERVAIASKVAEAFGGSFDQQKWRFELPSGLGDKDMHRVMRSLGSGFFANVNPGHGLKALLFGSHWELNYKGNWYHFIFLHGSIFDLELSEFHYEKFKPDSDAHWQDYKATGGKTTGELPCP